VFELAKGSDTIHTLASFTGTNGGGPVCALVMDSRGNLYGTTYLGGASGDGTVFELAKGSDTIHTLASFTGTNGANPEAGLVMDSSGNLYGTTNLGGATNDGTVFELAKGSGTIQTLASFNGTNGANPSDSLIMDSSGNLFGTTVYGGASGDGTVFELAHGSDTIHTLASFNVANGANPSCALIMDSGGNLYGTTQDGGASGDGTVFELAHGTHTITTLASFNGTNGYNPAGGLIMDGSGDLYGATEGGGGLGEGTVFELSRASSSTDQSTGVAYALDTNASAGATSFQGTTPLTGQTPLFTNNASVTSFPATGAAGLPNVGLNSDSAWAGPSTQTSPLAVTGDSALASGTFDGSGAAPLAGSVSQGGDGQTLWTGLA
jgi:uncharacterized repeat protein (TIGR03803 family)